MLESLRKFVGSWVAKVFLGILIASFAVWGIAGEVFGPGSSNAVATVGETKVPPSRYVASYYTALENVRQAFGRQPTRQQARELGLEQQALAQVVSAATLDEYARRLGVTLSDTQLARLIGEQRSFQDSQGRFDRRRFQEAVRNARTNEDTFIEDQNRAAVRAQIGSAAVAGDLLPKVYEEAALLHANERRVFELAEITPETVGPVPEPTDAQLIEWFDARKEEYRAPEYRKLAVLKIEPDDLVDPAIISAEAVEEEYERRIQAYRTPERRTIEQLPFPDAAAAAKARAAIDDGATFETVMAEAGIAPDVTRLGKLSRDQVSDPAIAEAAFALDLNETSQVVDGRFGPVLVRVTEIEAEQTRPLAEVEGEIRQTLALQDAARRIGDLYAAIEDARAGGGTVAEIAEANGLTVRRIEAIDAGGRGSDAQPVEPPLPASRSLLTEAFRTDVGIPTNGIPIGTTGYAWFDVEAIDPARERTLDEWRANVARDWKAAELAKLLDANAEALAKSVREGKAMAEAAAAANLTVAATEPMDRRGADPRIGREGIEAGFDGPVGTVTVATPGPGRRVVLRVAEIQAPEAAALPEAQLERARSGMANDLLQQVIARLQAEYGATVNRPLAEASLNQL